MRRYTTTTSSTLRWTKSNGRLPTDKAATFSIGCATTFAKFRSADSPKKTHIALRSARHSSGVLIRPLRKGQKVAEQLDRLIALRGMPESITSDDGAESTGRAVDNCAHNAGVEIDLICPGKVLNPAEGLAVQLATGRSNPTLIPDSRRQIRIAAARYGALHGFSKISVGRRCTRIARPLKIRFSLNFRVLRF